MERTFSSTVGLRFCMPHLEKCLTIPLLFCLFLCQITVSSEETSRMVERSNLNPVFLLVSNSSFSFICVLTLSDPFFVFFIYLRVSAEMSRGNRRGEQDASNVSNPVWEIPGS